MGATGVSPVRSAERGRTSARARRPWHPILRSIGAEQGLDDDLRPGLKVFQVGEDFARRAEAGLQNVLLARADGGAGDVAEVHDSEVDLADRGLVVVDQADALLAIRGFDKHFLSE